MSRRLTGRVAVVTGGTSGIGAATAELFASEGAQVVLTGRSEEKGHALADRLGPGVRYCRTDVTVESDIETAIALAVEEFGGLDVLFNNAGGPTPGTIDTITSEQIDHGVRLLLASVMFGMKHAIEPMKQRGGGSIINCSSVAALRHGQGGPLYSSLKAAVTHYTRLAAVELGTYEIRVNSISPGAIATPIFWGGSERANVLDDTANAKKLEKLTESLAKATPLPRSGVAHDVASAALYLATDESGFVNGHDLVVDGGRVQLFRE